MSRPLGWPNQRFQPTAYRARSRAIFRQLGGGWLIFNSIRGLDFPVIQGSVLILILAVATVNLAIDLLYPLLDPRIRQTGKA